jgi:hypothetical protein
VTRGEQDTTRRVHAFKLRAVVRFLELQESRPELSSPTPTTLSDHPPTHSHSDSQARPALTTPSRTPLASTTTATESAAAAAAATPTAAVATTAAAAAAAAQASAPAHAAPEAADDDDPFRLLARFPVQDARVACFAVPATAAAPDEGRGLGAMPWFLFSDRLPSAAAAAATAARPSKCYAVFAMDLRLLSLGSSSSHRGRKSGGGGNGEGNGNNGRGAARDDSSPSADDSSLLSPSPGPSQAAAHVPRQRLQVRPGRCLLGGVPRVEREREQQQAGRQGATWL